MESFWSELPPEILDLILQRLSLPDCFTFYKVCRSWRSVFLDSSRPPPWLLVTPGYRSDELSIETGSGKSGLLYGLDDDGRLRRLNSPMLNFLPSDKHIVGFSMGWLVTLGYVQKRGHYDIYLLNPISEERISLPPLECVTTNWVALSAAPTTKDCIIVLFSYLGYNVSCCAWCRPYDSEWTYFYIPFETSSNVTDILIYNDKLYILLKKGEFEVYSFGTLPSKIGGGSVFSERCSMYNICSYKQQLVQSGGDLLFVGWPNNEETIFDVFKQVEEMGRWVRVESLGDRVLLKGNGVRSKLQSISTQGLMGSGFEPNCIYLPIATKGLVKYSLTSKSWKRIPLPCSSCTDDIEWFFPQTWTSPSNLEEVLTTSVLS